MKNFFQNLLFVALLMFVNSLFANHLSSRIILSARLQGSNEVPAVTTVANGVASFMLNPTHDTMQVNIAFTGLVATAMHIHEGKPNSNGGVFKDLTNKISGNIARFILTGADLSPENLKKFLSGAFYLNVHTAANPGGEIRGQITVEDDKGYAAIMDGEQLIPAVATKARGAAVFSLDKSGQRFHFKVITTGLSGAITDAHLHLGKVGQNGGIGLDISAFIKGENVIGTIAAPTSLAANLALKNVYMSIHTAANPSGELRGQLELYEGLQFDAMLDNTQIGTSTVASTGQGVANLSLNYTMDTLKYSIVCTNLTSAIVSAHIHEAVVGQNGAVIFELAKAVDNKIEGMITGKNLLTTEVLSDLLSGNYYINVHTVNNPTTGEIRGQVYRLAREGYILELSGSQLNPALSNAAKGGGLVTIDRNQSTAHYMIAADGLSGAVTGAHFHKAVKGSNGGVIYEFPLANTGLYGYWSQSTTTKFTAAHARAFRGDSVYVAFHTAANPSGELRGQVIRDYKISTTTSKVLDATFVKNFTLYPNPVQDILTLKIQSENASQNELLLVDVLGRAVLRKTIDLLDNQNEINIDLAHLNQGTYFLSLYNSGKIVASALVAKEE